jgi:putative peptidoglycan lipid II flippase
VRPRFSADAAIREGARRVAPILAGETCVALNMVVDVGFAATLLGGSVSLIQYADRARVIPQTLLASSLLVVAYAAWSHLWAQKEEAAFRTAVDQALRWVAALSAPVLAGMFIGRELLIALLFERGAFEASFTHDVAQLLAWYLPGIWPNLLGILLMRAHVIEGRLKLVMGLGILSATTNVLLNTVLMSRMGLEGVALATTLNMFLIPGLFGVAFWPSWRSSFRMRSWAVVFGVVLSSMAVVFAVERSGGPPLAWSDGRLWMAAVCCFAILGVAYRWTNAPSERSVA